MLENLFFQGWGPVVRTAVGTVLSYIVLVGLLRMSGQRTLAKWYAFDLIVTMALGSAFASGILSKDVTVMQSAIGFAILILLQYTVAKVVIRWGFFRRVVNPAPALVLWRGQMRSQTMKSYRVAEADIRAAVRGHGHACIEEVGAVIIEPDGTFSVIDTLGDSFSALVDLPEFKDQHRDEGTPGQEQGKS